MNITQAEQALESTIIKSWNRIRSTSELSNFIQKRELALVRIQAEDFFDLDW